MVHHVDAHVSVCVCENERESMCVPECWFCALLWRTGKEGWEANLFLCRLTLSFQTPLFSKTPTISSVCLSPYPPPPHPRPPPSSIPPVSPLLPPYALCQSGYLHGLQWICVGEWRICSHGGGVEIHPRFWVCSFDFKSFSLFRKGQREIESEGTDWNWGRRLREDEDVHSVWPLWEKAPPFHIIQWVELNERGQRCFLFN